MAAHSSGSTSASRAQAIPSRPAIVIVAPKYSGRGGSTTSGDPARSSSRASAPGSALLSPMRDAPVLAGDLKRGWPGPPIAQMRELASEPRLLRQSVSQARLLQHGGDRGLIDCPNSQDPRQVP